MVPPKDGFAHHLYHLSIDIECTTPLFMEKNDSEVSIDTITHSVVIAFFSFSKPLVHLNNIRI
jgi:hypothetical protein